jgi:hypothetical protein
MYCTSSSIEYNSVTGRGVAFYGKMNNVELTFQRVALFSRERIEPQVHYPFYTMAITEHICPYTCVHLLLEMCSTSTGG